MRPGLLHLDIYQGDDFEKVLTFTEDDGTAIDVTGWTLKGEIRNAPGGTTVVETFTITKTNAVGGEIEMALTAAETLAVPAGIYYWDLQRTVVAQVRTLLAGKAVVRKDVTR